MPRALAIPLAKIPRSSDRADGVPSYLESPKSDHSSGKILLSVAREN